MLNLIVMFVMLISALLSVLSVLLLLFIEFPSFALIFNKHLSIDEYNKEVSSISKVRVWATGIISLIVFGFSIMLLINT